MSKVRQLQHFQPNYEKIKPDYDRTVKVYEN